MAASTCRAMSSTQCATTPSLHALHNTPMKLLFVRVALGRVDGFDDDEAQSECDEGSEVPVRFLATERNALEALELAHKLLDTGTSPVERLREERWSVPGG